MAKYADEYPQTGEGLLDTHYQNGRVKSFMATCAVEAADDNTTVFKLGKMPSDAVIMPEAMVYHTALTGLTGIDIGVTSDQGVASAEDKILDGLNVVNAGSSSLWAGAGNGNAITDPPEKLWQLLDFPEDPGGMLELSLSLKADVSAAGTIKVSMPYAKP